MPPQSSACIVRQLNGSWLIACDPLNEGRQAEWFRDIPADARPAPVPGIIQQVFPGFHGVAWYWHRFGLSAAPAAEQRALLRFGAVDYLGDVWVNGRLAGSHENGETPFELDVTGMVRPGQNLLAVRVLNPTSKPIDGYVLQETAHRNKLDSDRLAPGCGPNIGGIILPVELAVVPAMRVTDVFARPSVHDGRIDLTVAVRNDLADAADVTLSAGVAPDEGGDTLDACRQPHRAPPGDSSAELSLTVPQHRLWELDDPYLYRLDVHAEVGAGDRTLTHRAAVCCGFRDFRVADGYFHLNGKRVFLRSTHTGNHFPVGISVSLDPDLVRRDLIMAKAGGYNTVRFIAGMALPQQLDFCDHMGLMVYEEHLGSWLLGDSPHTAERFQRATREMITRDRNHPCVTIWGLLNETRPGKAFEAAVDSLELVRSLDPTRLVLLSSGRWDSRFSIGSVSNPGSTRWEPVWGVDGIDPNVHPVDATGYVAGAGDAHFYPTLPLSKTDEQHVRTMGQDTRPVFLSEYGVGSQFNAIEELRGFDPFNVGPDLVDVALIRTMASRAAAELERFGMAGLYPFPEDLFRDSYRHSVQQRRRSFGLIRANPHLCGYNLTGMLDHAFTGEGLWTMWRRWKPGAAEMLQDGWAPLRWCLFVDPIHGYAGSPLTVEAVLANEQVLAPGEYPAVLRIWREGGVVWEKKTPVRIPAPAAGRTHPPLAVPVLKETIDMGLPAGRYVFAACLEKGGIAAGDRLEFRLSDQPRGRGRVLTTGIEPAMQQWLVRAGVECHPFNERSAADSVVLVGSPQDSLEQTYAALIRHAEDGATVIFLSAGPFMTRPRKRPADWKPPSVLPLGDAVAAREFHDWLYHKEIVAKRHPVFDGLPVGLLQWDDYGPVLGHDVLDCRPLPDEVVAASLAVGYPCPGGVDSGVILGIYHRGRGRVVVTALRLLEEAATHPAAGRILLNLASLE